MIPYSTVGDGQNMGSKPKLTFSARKVKCEIIHRGRITSNKKGGTTIMGKMWVPVEDDGGENSWLGGAVGLTMQERDEELGL